MNDPYSPPASQTDPAEDAPVTVTISAKSVRRINSPLYFVVAALTGVSITFMPLALLALGMHNSWNPLTIGAGMICWLVSYLVPMFYFRIAGEVVKQVYRRPLNDRSVE